MSKHHKHHNNKPKHYEYTGMIRLNSKSVGYVSAEGLTEDVEIAPDKLNTALHRDTVRIRTDAKPRRGRIHGTVEEVVERARTRFVGTLVQEGKYRFVEPDDRRVYTTFILEHDAPTDIPVGHKVAVDLIRWDKPDKNPLVALVEDLGEHGTHETEMRGLVAAQGFDWHFPPDVEKQADELEKNKEQLFATEIPRRRDVRDTVTFTIDPADAKDFDDAISVRELENGNVELGVHIADVSAYVTRDSPIDKEAQKRATSIYLVDRTIPMLPEVLSNNLCSLVPHEDRLAMSAIFEMTREGVVKSRWFGETVINSSHRFSYVDAQAVLTAGTGEFFDELQTADTIARALRDKRMKNGSIAFETDEIKFELDERGRPLRAFRKERIETMMMIEDLMLLANREVAAWVAKQYEKKPGKQVFVWRVHDSPKPERIEELALFLKVLGYELPHKDGVVSAKELNALFEEVAGTTESDMIETAAIRSMAKAVYSMKNIGHFGLAFQHYTHFTSPIRRYPDLMVHRIVKGHNAGKAPGAADYAWHERMCVQSSEREVAAAEAERDSIKLKQVEYMASHVGEEFEGVISGVTDYGIFVEETTTMAEGLVRSASMKDDYYERGSHGYRLIGNKTGNTLQLGDKVRMRLKGVNIEDKQINWELLP